MGSYRSSPDLTKHSYQMSSLDHSYAVTHMCGWRRYMEDASLIISPFTYKNYSLFGLFDGHGGPEVALFVQKHFPQQLEKNKNFQVGNFQSALKETFLHLDKMLEEQCGRQEIRMIRAKEIEKQNSSEDSSISRIGCTALVALVTKTCIYIANAGDCRAVAVTYSGQTKRLTTDHKPFVASEEQRIIKAGGFVQYGRVNGCLNLSRAIGDLQFKQNKQLSPQEQMITSLPDVTIIDRKDLHFIFMCCDGVWECKQTEDTAQWMQKKLQNRTPLAKGIQQLLEEIVAKDSKEDRGTDNMSAILVKFDKKNSILSY